MKNKTTAGILALLLGGLGVHRFYLGQTWLGVFYLVFCWTFIPAFVAVFDGIIFLDSSHDEFNAKYNKSAPVKSYTERTEETPPRNIASVKELFSHDFENFNKDDFNFIGEETNSAGQIVKKYRKVLSYKEAGLFEIINVNDIEGSRNYTLENGRYNKSDYQKIENIITSVYYLLGKDSSHEGLITTEEKERFLSGSSPRISRMWTDSHLIIPVLATFDSDGYDFTLFGMKATDK